MALTSKKITQITKNQDTNTILFKNADGDIVTACAASGLIAEEREDGAKVVVMTSSLKTVVSLTVDDIATPAVTDSQDLITQLSEDFFFDVSGSADQVVKGEVNNIPSGSGVQTLAEFTTENNSIYFAHLHISSRNSLGESWSNYITNALRVRTSNTGVVSLDNTGAGAVFETFTVNPTFTLTSPANNTVRYTINFLTNTLASAKVTISLVKHKY